MCPVPPSGAAPATLHIVHEHDFDASYAVVDVAYKVGDCVLIRNSDMAALAHKTVDLGRHAILPGPTEVQLTTIFQSAFAADMHAYKWMGRVPFQRDVEPGSTIEIRARYHEKWAEDPRQRMKMDLHVDGRMMVQND